METCATAIHRKGCLYNNIVGFDDITFRSIDRFFTEQQYYYTGWKRSHDAKHKGITTPNLIISDVSGS